MNSDLRGINTSITERQGINLVESKIMSELKWIFREQPIVDYGIDAHIEVVNNKVTGNLIALQIKSGSSYFRESTAEHIVYRINSVHYEYWLNHSLPVIIVLCDIENGICYWEHINNENVVSAGRNYKVNIPKTQILTADSYRKLISIAENTTIAEKKYNALLLSRGLMQKIEAGNNVIVEFTEMINKMFGRETITVKVKENENEVEIEWQARIFPGESYDHLLNKLFPWADIGVDEDFYEEYDVDQYKLDFGFWDGEEGDYFIDYEGYREWRENLPTIRPYEIESNELAKYRMELQLNSLGKAFLRVSDYLE
ncbi:DUF4365 domain-containing protein [Kurthia gibsonii]|uniref:DUF4365 domain-containing protein n=1 Tax=Kurthia gibsonii TaxID=33946 RepID=UPI00301895BD